MYWRKEIFMKDSYMEKKEGIERKWFVIDAEGRI
jgi:ribosomal protein L13